MPPLLSVQSLVVRFTPGGPPAVDGVSLHVEKGEILAILGPSGCGKTTTLRVIAGFEAPDEGEVLVNGLVVADASVQVPPERRDIGLIFQDYALFPHLTVAENVAFGLRRVPANTRSERIARLMDLLGLAGLEDRRPHHLSGGQQQRVAVARSLATEPALILMDEPFSNLDAQLRQSTRQEIREILKTTGATTILVTHDQEEALSFADRVAVMRNGRIEQVGTPEKVYGEPKTLFVAQFLGRTNLLVCEASGNFADTPIGKVRLNRPARGSVLLALRPEHVTLEAVERDTQEAPVGTVTEREFRGHDVTYQVDIDGTTYTSHMHSRESFRAGQRVSVRVTEPAVVLERKEPPQPAP